MHEFVSITYFIGAYSNIHEINSLVTYVISGFEIDSGPLAYDS